MDAKILAKQYKTLLERAHAYRVKNDPNWDVGQALVKELEGAIRAMQRYRYSPTAEDADRWLAAAIPVFKRIKAEIQVERDKAIASMRAWLKSGDGDKKP